MKRKICIWILVILLLSFASFSSETNIVKKINKKIGEVIIKNPSEEPIVEFYNYSILKKRIPFKNPKKFIKASAKAEKITLKFDIDKEPNKKFQTPLKLYYCKDKDWNDELKTCDNWRYVKEGKIKNKKAVFELDKTHSIYTYEPAGDFNYFASCLMHTHLYDDTCRISGENTIAKIEPQYPNNITFLDDFLLWYKFNETNDLTDLSGNGNDGSFYSPWISGKIGNAYEFVEGNYMVIPEHSQYQTLNNFTFEFWINYNSAGAIFDRNVNGQDSIYIWRHGPGAKLKVTIYNESGVSCFLPSTSSLQIGTWTYAVVTYDGSELKIYLNGVLNGTLACYGNLRQGDGENFLGARSDLEYKIGAVIDEFRIYNKTLTEEEIQQQYERQKNGLTGNLTNGLVAYFPLNETSGITANEEVYGNDATAYGIKEPNYLADTLIDGGYNFSANYLDAIITNSIITTNKITYGGWFYFDDFNCNGGYCIPLQQADEFDVGYEIYIDALTKEGACWDGSSSASLGYLDSEKWYNLICVHNGTQMCAYKNAKLIQCVSSNAIPPSANVSVGGGYQQRTYYFSGKVDDVYIINKSLNEEEIEKLFALNLDKYLVGQNKIKFSANNQTLDCSMYKISGRTNDYFYIDNSSDFKLTFRNCIFNSEVKPDARYMLFGEGNFYFYNNIFEYNPRISSYGVGARFGYLNPERSYGYFYNNTFKTSIKGYNNEIVVIENSKFIDVKNGEGSTSAIKDLTVNNCEVVNSSFLAIKNGEIKNSKFYNNSEGAIFIEHNNRYSKIYNNEFWDNGNLRWDYGTFIDPAIAYYKNKTFGVDKEGNKGYNVVIYDSFDYLGITILVSKGVFNNDTYLFNESYNSNFNLVLWEDSDDLWLTGKNPYFLVLVRKEVAEKENVSNCEELENRMGYEASLVRQYLGHPSKEGTGNGTCWLYFTDALIYDNNTKTWTWNTTYDDELQFIGDLPQFKEGWAYDYADIRFGFNSSYNYIFNNVFLSRNSTSQRLAIELFSAYMSLHNKIYSNNFDFAYPQSFVNNEFCYSNIGNFYNEKFYPIPNDCGAINLISPDTVIYTKGQTELKWKKQDSFLPITYYLYWRNDTNASWNLLTTTTSTSYILNTSDMALNETWYYKIIPKDSYVFGKSIENFFKYVGKQEFSQMFLSVVLILIGAILLYLMVSGIIEMKMLKLVFIFISFFWISAVISISSIFFNISSYEISNSITANVISKLNLFYKVSTYINYFVCAIIIIFVVWKIIEFILGFVKK